CGDGDHRHLHSFPTRRSSDLLTNPAGALVTWWPLLFAVAYQVFTNLVGWPTWAMILASPVLIPLAITLGVAGLVMIADQAQPPRSEEHTSELQSRENLVCRLL